MKSNSRTRVLTESSVLNSIEGIDKELLKKLDWYTIVFVVIMFLMGSFLSYNYIVSTIRVFPQKSFETYSLYDKPIILEKVKETVIIPKVDELFEFYSFEYTSFGFGFDRLDIIENSPRFEAEQNLLELVPKHLKKRAKKYIRPVLLLCERHQIDPLWVLSVMWTESHFKYTAISHVGAAGLMQVMPETKSFLYRTLKRRGKKLVVETKDFKISEYFFNIAENDFKTYKKKLINIELGIIYLKQLLKQFNYSHKLATVAYNMGPGWTEKRIRNNLPVGEKNEYLDKVKKAYFHFVNKIKST